MMILWNMVGHHTWAVGCVDLMFFCVGSCVTFSPETDFNFDNNQQFYSCTQMMHVNMWFVISQHMNDHKNMYNK